MGKTGVEGWQSFPRAASRPLEGCLSLTSTWCIQSQSTYIHWSEATLTHPGLKFTFLLHGLPKSIPMLCLRRWSTQNTVGMILGLQTSLSATNEILLSRRLKSNNYGVQFIPTFVEINTEYFRTAVAFCKYF
jgi:hypothetical protein